MILKHKILGGFSLLEIMCTIAICMVSLLLFVHLSDLFKYSLVKYEAEKVLELFHKLHFKAQLEQRSIKLTFDKIKHLYCYDGQQYKLSDDVQFGAPQHVLGPPSSPNHLINNPITFVDECVTFFENGSISSGTIYFTNKKYSVCYAVTTPISSISYIRLYSLNERVWQQVY